LGLGRPPPGGGGGPPRPRPIVQGPGIFFFFLKKNVKKFFPATFTGAAPAGQRAPRKKNFAAPGGLPFFCQRRKRRGAGNTPLFFRRITTTGRGHPPKKPPPPPKKKTPGRAFGRSAGGFRFSGEKRGFPTGPWVPPLAFSPERFWAGQGRGWGLSQGTFPVCKSSFTNAWLASAQRGRKGLAQKKILRAKPHFLKFGSRGPLQTQKRISPIGPLLPTIHGGTGGRDNQGPGGGGGNKKGSLPEGGFLGGEQAHLSKKAGG